MDNRSDNNATLYFIVGGLVVLALLFGFIYFNSGSTTGVEQLSPAAGYGTTTDRGMNEYGPGSEMKDRDESGPLMDSDKLND
ncbi:MAG: hypothetical protein HYU57_05920 [Micavibrio aeruginosavorus]|nr:hypothetical protein [Micavibrio aeruginosavorus]